MGAKVSPKHEISLPHLLAVHKKCVSKVCKLTNHYVTCVTSADVTRISQYPVLPELYLRNILSSSIFIVTVPSACALCHFCRRAKKMTEAEKWELKQLGMSGVMSVQEHPLYDEEGGLGVLAAAEEEAEEEFEIDLNDEEPEFLKGHSTKSGVEMSPIKIVKNPEGSMQRAAMTQVRDGGLGSREGVLGVERGIRAYGGGFWV
jgi:hypothetical protein